MCILGCVDKLNIVCVRLVLYLFDVYEFVLNIFVLLFYSYYLYFLLLIWIKDEIFIEYVILCVLWLEIMLRKFFFFKIRYIWILKWLFFKSIY